MERFLHLLHKAIALFLGLREGLLSPSLLGTWKISAVRVLDEEERVGTIKSGNHLQLAPCHFYMYPLGSTSPTGGIQVPSSHFQPAHERNLPVARPASRSPDRLLANDRTTSTTEWSA